MKPEDRPQRAGVSEIIAAALITLAQVPLAIVFTVFLMLLSINGDSCEPQTCNVDEGQASILMPLLVGAIVLTVTIVLVVVDARRGGAVWRAPVIGLAIVIADFVIAVIINATSLTPSG
ncbi:MAG TPA: hypothetical protein VGM94_14145 [Galbitalea sp.]|jgi:hypothetical protein